MAPSWPDELGVSRAASHAGSPIRLGTRADCLPTVHFGPKSAVLTRTGKPVPKALRNERIRKFNKILEGIHLRRLALQRKEEQAKRSDEALEMVLKEQQKRSRRNLHRL